MSTDREALLREAAALIRSDCQDSGTSAYLLSRIDAALAAPPQAAQHQHSWVSSPHPLQPGVPREICWCGAIRAGSYVPQAAPPDGADRAYAYALNLAKAMHAKHYADTAPQWEPFPDLLGLLTQIDNMTAGLTKAAQPAEAPEPWVDGNGVIRSGVLPDAPQSSGRGKRARNDRHHSPAP